MICFEIMNIKERCGTFVFVKRVADKRIKK